MTGTTTPCLCNPSMSVIEVEETPHPACPVHGLDLHSTDGLAAALRYAGVEIGSVGGDRFRHVVADRLLPLLTARLHTTWQDGYRQGVADERHTAEIHDGTPSPDRPSPFQSQPRPEQP